MNEIDRTCEWCQKQIGPNDEHAFYAGSPMHTECMKRFGDEMDFIDKLRNAGTTTVMLSNGTCATYRNTIDCEHCKMPIESSDEIWVNFDDTIHEGCKTEYLTMTSRKPERAGLFQRIRNYLKWLGNAIVVTIYPE